jgi:hypothetical protein
LRGYDGVQQEPDKRPGMLDGEIEPIICVIFLLFVFLLVPFTVLSPFRYPERSALDKIMAVNAGDSVNSAYRLRANDARMSGVRVIDLSAVAAEQPAAKPVSVTR